MSTIRFKYTIGHRCTDPIHEIESENSLYADVARAVSLLHRKDSNPVDVVIWDASVVDEYGPYGYRFLQHGTMHHLFFDDHEMHELRERALAVG